MVCCESRFSQSPPDEELGPGRPKSDVVSRVFADMVAVEDVKLAEPLEGDRHEGPVSLFVQPQLQSTISNYNVVFRVQLIASVARAAADTPDHPNRDEPRT